MVPHCGKGFTEQMKIVLVIFAAVLLAGSGAVGGYLYFSKVAEASPGEMAVHEKVAKEKPPEADNAVEFVQLEPMILPIIDDYGVTQTVSLVVTLEAPDKESAELVRKMAPRLKDAFIQDLYGVLSRKASMKGGVIEVAKLKERLKRMSHKVMGQEVVNDVLLQVVNQRKI